MYEPDNVAILPGDALVSTDDDELANPSSGSDRHGEDDDAPTTRSVRPRCKCSLPVSVEPVMFLSMFSLTLQAPLTTQYLWDRISEDLGYNGTLSSGCTNASKTLDPLQEKVETLTAQWTTYISLATFGLGLLSVPLLGAWSDLAGRKPVLVLANLGLALQAGIYLVVMYLKLHVGYLLLGRLLSGLSGDFNAILAGCFSYVADISEKRSRTFRVAILESCIGIAGVLASIIGGHWLRAQGYINPFWLVFATALASALYTYLFVRESVLPDPSAKLLTFRHYKSVWRLFATGGINNMEGGLYHRCKLWLYTLCFFVIVTVHIGSKQLSVLFELSSPLCWGPTLIGYGSALQMFSFLTSLLGLKIMQQCLTDSWVALVGLVSNISGLVVFSLADTTQLVFTGLGLCLLSMTMTPVIRSKLSKLVEPSEQGALFASVACVESLCFLVGYGFFNFLYPATLHIMKGFPFLFAAITLLIPTGIIVTLECIDQRKSRKEPIVS